VKRQRWTRIDGRQLPADIDRRLNYGRPRDQFDPRYAETEETWLVEFVDDKGEVAR
jgi:hypothetical protein